MPIGLGLASSHSPNMFVPPEKWHIRYEMRTRLVPQPPAAKQETPEVIHACAARMTAGFDVLRQKISEYLPAAIIMVSDDQGEVFDREAGMPTVAIHSGESCSGSLNLGFLGADAPTDRITLKGHPELAMFIARRLVEREFDLTVTHKLRPLGDPKVGLSHGFTRTAPKLMPALDIPVILIFLNCYYEPLPTARRCLHLGRSLAAILKDRPERIAIYGSGGLSHDPMGPRAGWVDEPLDRFVLQSLADGEPDRLSGLYTVDSDTMRGGTGEIRNWLVTAGAMGDRKATIVDYMAVHHALAGIGFAYWAPG